MGYLYLTQLSGRLLSDAELQVFLNRGDLINGLRISNKRNGDARVETVIEFLTLPPVLIVDIMPMEFDSKLDRVVVVGWSIRSLFTSILKLPGPRPLRIPVLVPHVRRRKAGSYGLLRCHLSTTRVRTYSQKPIFLALPRPTERYELTSGKL